ncbi:hypothetical protein INN71_06960 [Nocardioides sp. ChNu-153]|uniref:hypothetical protein n=1 Tax=Nocardioides sp. ChNu-153 TaxID=2779364 RepID=UPI00265249D0|nr:hypothetical protein [Nocardioides sp. ChNu-153]MDN7121129.1 hypothetical protein [Nocardioides sp. ChNu-153]
MHTTDARDGGDDIVREYVALDRALRRLEAVDAGQSAGLRLQLYRARAAYHRSGARGQAAYADTLAVLGAACASALVEAGHGDAAPERPVAHDARDTSSR